MNSNARPAASPRGALLLLGFVFWACRSNTPTGTPPPNNPGTQGPTTGGTPSRTTVPAPQGTPPPNAPALEPHAAAGEFRDAATALPQGNVFEAWHQSGSVTRSAAANLFQIMDGEAESYVKFSVRQFAKTEYRKTGTQLVATAHVYEFATEYGAFGRYSLMVAEGRDPASLQNQAVQLGGGAYQGSTQLVFWKGSRLVQIDVTDESDDATEETTRSAAREVLLRLAKEIEKLVPGATQVPANPLPSDGLVWGGATLLPEGAFGSSGTGPAWIGYYGAPDGKRYRIGIFQRGGAPAAQQIFAKLKGAGTVVPALGDEAVQTTLQGGEALIARKGNTVWVVANAGFSPSAGAAPGGLDGEARTVLARRLLDAPLPANIPMELFGH